MFRTRNSIETIKGAALAALFAASIGFGAGCGGSSDGDRTPAAGGPTGDTSPSISVVANDPTASESGDTGQFTINLSTATDSDLNLAFALGGDAVLDVDYTADRTSAITILAGDDSAIITITPKSDEAAEDVETVELTLTLPEGYAAGNSLTASVEIAASVETDPDDLVLSGLNLRMKSISAGTFTMGNYDTDRWTWDGSGPQAEVTISQDFMIAETETTVGQFREFLLEETAVAAAADAGSPVTEGTPEVAYLIADPAALVNFGSTHCAINNDADFSYKEGYFYGDATNKPMVEITWEACKKFADWLTARERVAGNVPEGYEFRLPTEAEWEYCCRAETTTTYSFEYEGQFPLYAWYWDNSYDGGYQQRVHEVASKRPNPWGLYDMHGNAAEWTNDTIYNYSADPKTDPKDSRGTERSIRGGSAQTPAPIDCGSAARDWEFKDNTGETLGFRVVLAPIAF